MRHRVPIIRYVMLITAMLMTFVFSSRMNSVFASIVDSEHFTEEAEGVDELDAMDFSSARLVVLTDSKDVIVDPEHLIAVYDTIYLLQYSSVKQAMNAYVYYTGHASAVEPDMDIETASEMLDAEIRNDEIEFNITQEDNPIGNLLEESNSVTVWTPDRIIALIDTGTSEGANVIKRVSLIDETLNGNGHGDDMVNSMVSQNPDVKIFSVRAIGDNGRGTVSSIVAAMEYAMEQKVSIINLSLFAKTNLVNSVVKSEIEKAVSMGIDVVGAAGNDSADVKDYIPGSVEDAWILGSCNGEGVKLESSNYGETVDYNVVADSTSEAAAKFCGYISLYGTKEIVLNEGLVFTTDYQSETDHDEIDPDGTERDLLKVYYLIYDGGEDNVFSNFVLNFPYKVLDDRTIRSYINPDPEVYDYNDNGIELDVDINRGAPNGIQIPITEECFYNEEKGYIDIPGRYLNEDLTVTVWQSRDSRFYDILPDALKPQKDRSGENEMSIAAFLDDFTHGYYPAIWKPKGCNLIDLSYSIDDIKVGDLWTGTAETHYIGSGGKPWGSVEGAEEYDRAFHTGQVFNITSCQNPIFVNVGGKGLSNGLMGKNWLFTSCISSVSNNFAGDPIVTSLYIECIAKNGNTAEFYLHVKCKGPGGQTAQTMGGFFKAEFDETGDVKIKKTITNPAFASATPTIRIYTTFEIATDKNFKNILKSINLVGDEDESTKSVTIKNLEPGTYYLRETGRCTGCIVNESIYSFKVEEGKITNTFMNLDTNKTTTSIPNVPGRCVDGTILTKFDANTDAPLEGAIFKVIYSNQKRGTEGQEDLYTWYLRSDKNGKVKFDEDHYVAEYNGHKSDEPLKLYDEDTWALPPGFLYITEVKPPENYRLDDASEKALLLALRTDDDGNYTRTVIKAEPIIFKDSNIPVRVKIKKVSTANSEILGLTSYSTERTEFRVYTDSACKNRIAILKTGTDGITNVLTLPCIKNGTYTYYIREITPPLGHKQNSQVKSFTVSLPEDAGETKLVEFRDDPVFCGQEFNILKLSNNGCPISGVVFKVEYFDAHSADAGKKIKTWYLSSDEEGKIKIDDTHKITDRAEYKSDSFFTWNGNIVIPVGGYLQFTEMEVPAEYILEDTPMGFLTTETIETEKRIYNVPEPCKITLCKYDNNHDPLSGVTFRLTFVKAARPETDLADQSFKPLLKEGESVSLMTDTNGKVIFENLDQGSYKITEIAAVTGKTLLAEPITITLPLTMTKEEVDAKDNIDLSKAKLNKEYDETYYFFEAAYEVTNTAAFKVPMTGTAGNWRYGYIGVAMIFVFGAAFVISSRNKKKNL